MIEKFSEIRAGGPKKKQTLQPPEIAPNNRSCANR